MPNSATIGGSGTWVPELVLVLPLVELEPLVDELLEVEELVELEVDVLEVMLPEVELLVETLPDEDEVLVTLPELVEVELPPVEVEVDDPPVEVDDPPVEVEVELPLTLTTTPLLELPEVEPLVVVVEVIWTWPPLLDPPKKPPKKPPPKPPPLEPPMMTGVPPPPPPPAMNPPAAGMGTGIGTIAICCSSAQTCAPSCTTRRLGASHSMVTMRWTRWILRGTTRRSVFTYLTGLVVFTSLTYLVDVAAAGASATWTAPPTASAPPAATADSFARAIRTDMVVLSASTGLA